MEEIQSQLDNSQESEYVRIEMSRWETRFGLAGNPREKVEDYPGLVKAIRSLAYKGIRTASETDPAEPA